MAKRNSDLSPFKKLRQSGKLPMREELPVIVIICEGKTEVNYFRSFRVTNDVYSDPVTQPDQILDKAIERKKHLDPHNRFGIEVWCVFDRDIQYTNEGPIDTSDERQQKFDKAIHEAKKKGIRVAYSNDCFELWFLLHFEFLQSAIDRLQYRIKLRGYLGEYKKGSSDNFTKFENRMNIAIRNATKLYSSEYYERDDKNELLHPRLCCPVTTVHILVERLLEIKHKRNVC